MAYTIEQLQALIDNSVAGEWRLNRAEVRGYADNVNDGYGQPVCLVANMETSDGELLAASKAIAQQLVTELARIKELEAGLRASNKVMWDLHTRGAMGKLTPAGYELPYGITMSDLYDLQVQIDENNGALGIEDEPK